MRKKSAFGLLKDKIVKISNDFDAPLLLNYVIKDDFNIKAREELECIQKGLDEIKNAFAELEIKLAGILKNKSKNQSK